MNGPDRLQDTAAGSLPVLTEVFDSVPVPSPPVEQLQLLEEEVLARLQHRLDERFEEQLRRALEPVVETLVQRLVREAREEVAIAVRDLVAQQLSARPRRGR